MIRGLYGIADARYGDPLFLARAMLRGGCRVIQLRCKTWSADQILPVATTLATECAAAGAMFFVNDDPDLARESGATGVHVGQTDGEGAAIRARLAKGQLLGRSSNSLEQLAAVADADYVAFGPVFATTNLSRPKGVRGLSQLRSARALTNLPLVAIGGITETRLPLVRPHVDAWAVIGSICGAEDPVRATRSLH